jgi:aryl-alcohol dehydrogenase-like predicted oxidoreductase
MRYRSLGDSGLLVSVADLGCNNFGSRLDVQQTRAVVDAAIDAGITLFDTADIYGNAGGSEEMLGEVLGVRRDQIVLATKFGHQRVDMGYGPAAGAKGGRAYIRRAVEQSLRRLRTDYLDLYQLHTPDPVTPIGETLHALSELVTEGKVRYVGHSNFSGRQIADAAHLAREAGTEAFISAQNNWSLLERQAEAEVVPAALRFGLGVLPYYPLANGLLTGKVRRGQAPPAGSRLASRESYITEPKLDRWRRRALGLRARGQPARRGHRRPGGPAGLRVGDRRGDVTGSGQGEHRGRGVDPAAGRAGRARPDRAPARSRVSAAGQFLMTALL